MNIKFYTIIVLIVLISSCASTPQYVVSQKWDKSKLAKVHVYRTNVLYHKFNPEKPFFYMDGKSIGKLGTGQSISIKVPAGKHIITTKESFLFMPSYESGKLEIEIKENETYYVRYSKDFSSILLTGNGPVTTGATSIQLSNKEYYLQRK